MAMENKNALKKGKNALSSEKKVWLYFPTKLYILFVYTCFLKIHVFIIMNDV